MDTSSNEYLIVEFPKEQEEGQSVPMAVISSKWTHEINGVIHCWWPQYISSQATRNKTVKFHYEIDTDKSVSCPIIVKYSTSDYNDAIQKIKKLEIDSEIESQSESELRRKKAPPRFQDYFSDFEEDYRPTLPPPQPNGFKEAERNKIKHTAEHKSTRPLSLAAINRPEPSSSANSSDLITLTSCFTENNNLVEKSTEHGTKKKKSCCCEKNLAIMTNMCKEMKLMNSKLNELSLITQRTDSLGVCQTDIPNALAFKDLQKLNSDLNNSDFQLKLSRRLGLIGGKDAQETTRNILSALISHDLALNMNFSVRSNPLSEKATDKEIQAAMINWFRTAGDREGGRIRRFKDKE